MSAEEAEWRRAWRARSAAPNIADLRGRVEAETRRLRLAMIGPIITTLAAGGGALAIALIRQRPADVALAIGVWVFIVAVWIVALWAARGTWRPPTETTDGFVRLSIRRCRSVIEGLYAGVALYVVGFVGILWWKYHYLSISLDELLTSWQVLMLGLAITPVVLYASHSLARQKRAELRALSAMLGELDNETP
ncbi:MAG TPA: hypothetical protein VFS58_06885 [Steroidobacteraceae bacterium]|nr:hypothetical protein [Steroidobacteraceae bacterium]